MLAFSFAPEDYMKHLEEYMELDEVSFSPEQSKEEIIARLREISIRKKEISGVQNSIISEYIARFEDGTELTEEAAEKLYAFLETMFVIEPVQCFDPPVALRLARVLCEYYRGNGNLEKLAFVLRFGSVSEMFMKVNLEEFHFLTFPQICEEYLPMIDQLSPQAQDALMIGYYYRLITKSDEDLPHILDLYPVMEKRLRDFYLNKRKDDARFKMFELKLRHNLLSMFSLMGRLNDEAKKLGKKQVYDVDVEKYRGMLERAVETLTEELKEAEMSAGAKGQMNTTLAFARFHLGHISFDELLKTLDVYGLSEAEDPASQMMMLQANGFYLTYLHGSSPYSREEEYRLGRERIQKVMPKVLEMKKQKMYMFAPMVVAFLGATSFFALDFQEFFDIALEFTVYADKALYVHTVMVKEICHLILEQILEKNPELVDGVNGWDVQYIKEHKDKVLALMDLCAMCHDIGKHYIIDVVSNSSRRLTEDEFGMIKHHPQYFEEFYQKTQEEKARITCIRDCALLHHRWHNEQGGYPELPHTVNRPFVDILAIADSLDAATDYIGRPYGKGKTLDQLLAEFLEQGGTRYGKEVAEILNQPEVKAAVADVITKRREEVNYRIYAFHEIEGV